MVKKIRIGVLGPADIAYRKMIPALLQNGRCEYIGVAFALPEERYSDSDNASELLATELYDISIKKAEKIKESYGGSIYNGYFSMLESEDIDAIYIPLPPILHTKWGLEALSHGKHVFMEKPFSASYCDTRKIVKRARIRELALSENFAFVFHPQIRVINEIIESGIIGNITLIRSNFGFPHRSREDFRYKKAMGGGALLDCGCYTIKLAQIFLGYDLVVEHAHLFSTPDEEVDIYGTITAVNHAGIVAQLSFSMDQQYCCELEIWGSKGCIVSPRVYTAPENLELDIEVRVGCEVMYKHVEMADQFNNSLNAFLDNIENREKREIAYDSIDKQGMILEKCLGSCKMASE